MTNFRVPLEPVLTVFDAAAKETLRTLAYLLVGDRAHRYPNNLLSRIYYIGSTSKGLERAAGSAAERAHAILNSYGVTSFDVFIVPIAPGRGPSQNWRRLERALLQEFKQRYGRVPICNTQGKNIPPPKTVGPFSRDKILELFLEFED